MEGGDISQPGQHLIGRGEKEGGRQVGKSNRQAMGRDISQRGQQLEEETRNQVVRSENRIRLSSDGQGHQSTRATLGRSRRGWAGTSINPCNNSISWKKIRSTIKMEGTSVNPPEN